MWEKPPRPIRYVRMINNSYAGCFGKREQPYHKCDKPAGERPFERHRSEIRRKSALSEQPERFPCRRADDIGVADYPCENKCTNEICGEDNYSQAHDFHERKVLPFAQQREDGERVFR